MRIKLKGLNYSTKRMANGKIVRYWYAWRGGPRLPGQPGTAEFVAAYNAAINQRATADQSLLPAILDAFQDSADFKELAERTQRDYRKHLRAIANEFFDFPVAALSNRKCRAEFLNWRDDLAKTSKRGADYRLTVFARALSWAADRGLISNNPLRRPGRLYKSSRIEIVWTADDESDFLRAVPHPFHLPFLLALWTGQRQGDVLKLTWADYDGQKIKLKQSKTNARIVIPVGAPLKEALDAELQRRRILIERNPSLSLPATICLNSRHQAWSGDGFRCSLGKALKVAGLSLPKFMDLRGTVVTRLALAGATVPEIASITGHSLKNVAAILDAHYLNRDYGLAKNAIQALENQLASSNQPSNRKV